MWPTLYTEHDLAPVPGTSPSEGALHLIDHWLSAETRSELQRRIRDALQASGFDWMSYGTVVWRDGVPVTTRLLSSHSNPRWTQLYFGEGCHEVDPLLQKVRSSSLPFAWSVDDAGAWMQHPHATPEQARIPALLRDCGIESGVLIALPPGLCSNECTVVGLSSRQTGREWMDDGVLGQSLMLALCLHELLTIYMTIADGVDRSAPVSPTRREILRHLAQGQSNKQIAHRLQLSPDTVKYHMRELRRHFNVRNRMQLVNSQIYQGE